MGRVTVVCTKESSVITGFDTASSPPVVVAKMNIQAPFVQICKWMDTEMNNEGSFVQILLMIDVLFESDIAAFCDCAYEITWLIWTKTASTSTEGILKQVPIDVHPPVRMNQHFSIIQAPGPMKRAFFVDSRTVKRAFWPDLFSRRRNWTTGRTLFGLFVLVMAVRDRVTRFVHPYARMNQHFLIIRSSARTNTTHPVRQS